MAALVPSTRLNNAFFNERHIGRTPVERTKALSIVVPDLVATVTTTETVMLNGLLADIITAAPNIPTDANFTVAIINEDGITELTSGNIADNSNVITNVVSSNIYCVGQYTIKITFSTDLAGNTTEFDVYFKMITT